ncbi:MAG TPA: amidohydrolase family protein [Phenylobacterium sp.]|uniref:amidohydrolase n=1 Tax=Phenylobacterium sp. TaxID=1871053 RepID=UPI002B49ABBC|nr:amidohydrolase family protein [Phenylobacterium sp.]HKR87710.1 amidohydrolase family protein [Phenylobacterium sp.]
MALLTRRAIWASTPALMLVAAAPGVLAAPEAADTILSNGQVFTVDQKRSWAQAVAIRAGKIVYVGSNEGASAFRGARTQVIDAGGRVVLPGFIDTHNHVYLRAEEMFWLKLPGAPRPIGPADPGEASMESYRQAIAAYRAKNLGLQQIRGVGFHLEWLRATASAQGKPPRALLDELVGDIPAAIVATSHHELWVNSAALRRAGLTKDTPEPAGAVIERDPKTGEPNGILHEFGAHDLVLSKLPQPDSSTEEYRQAVESWQQLAARRGVTGAIVPTHVTTLPFFNAMQRLSDEGKLTARYNVAQWANENRGVSQVPELIATRARFAGGRYFKLNTIKIFATGVPGAGKEMLWAQDSLNATMAAFDKAGFRLYIHDIGSTESYGKTLDAFEYALTRNGPRDSRHIISHVFPMAAPLAGRFKALGVRADGHPAPKVFYDLGVPTTCSSDYPVWDFNPLPRIQRGVQEGVPLQDMIVSQTLRGAEALFAETETGSIEVGKAADLIVLDRDIFRLAPEAIGEAKVILSMFAGAVQYRDDKAGFAAAGGRGVAMA